MNFTDIMNMLRNPQAIQAQVEEMRVKTIRIQATGSSGGGMVRVTLNGALDMLSCEILPEVVDPADVAMLQDLVRAAYNDAVVKVKEEVQREFAGEFGGLPLPPGAPGGI
jgi:DNA-binding YbaB/EbfC family protein